MSRDELAEVQAILDKYGITREALDQAQQAEADAIATGTVIPLRRSAA